MKKHNCFQMMKDKFTAPNMRCVLAAIWMASLIGITDLANAQTQLVTVNRDGSSGSNGLSHNQKISPDGRFVAFQSNASDLVSNDTNGQQDVFVRDLQNGITALVSVNADGTNSGNGNSSSQAMSPDGRFVVFVSYASDLVSNDTNSQPDVFVRDLQSGTTTLVSINRSGTASGNGSSFGYGHPTISADGRFVAFESEASDLVSNDTNGYRDIFVRDLQNQATTLVSVNRTGTNGGNRYSYPSVITSNGRFVVFTSSASDLVSNDTNGTYGDVFIRDLQNGITTLVSVKHNGTGSGNRYSQLVYMLSAGQTDLPVISTDGRFVSFVSWASDLVSNDTNNSADIFVRDLQTGTTTLASIDVTGTFSGSSDSYDPVISANGRFVSFWSYANSLVVNDLNNRRDVFVRDLLTGITTLVSVNQDGTNSGNDESVTTSISADGRFVAFNSRATDLVPIAINYLSDWNVYVRDLQNGKTTLASINRTSTSSGNRAAILPVISADGRFVVFYSLASDLVNMDTKGGLNIFVRGNNQPPTVAAGGPYSVNEGASFTVTAFGNDPENGPLTYAWDLDNDGNFETSGPSVAFSAANFDGPSTHTINVQVTDNGGLTATDQAAVNVLNVAPTATLTNLSGTIIAGQSATLAFSHQADPSSTDVTAGFTYSYDYTNDGTFEVSDAAAASSAWAYPVSGTFTATGRIKDKDGGFSDYTTQVIVQTPQDAAQNLIDQVLALNKPQGNGLIGMLNVVIARLDNNEIDKAIEMLEQFIKDLKKFIDIGKFSSAEGQPLLDAANAIIAALSGGTLPKNTSLDFPDRTSNTPPAEFRLEQNSPNPFNPVTTIQFSVPRESYVRLKVYNAFGAEVATLVDQQVAAGTYKINWDASRLASGFYLYRLEAEGFAQTKKLLLMK